MKYIHKNHRLSSVSRRSAPSVRLTAATIAGAVALLFGSAGVTMPGIAGAASSGSTAVIGTPLYPAGSGAGTAFPTDQSAPPDLSMIPSSVKNTANLDYNTNNYSQWGTTYGYCPPLTNFWIDNTELRTPASVASSHYMVAGYCNPIVGSGGDSERAEWSSHVQDEYVYEGDERWYYLSIKPDLNMPTPQYNYFIVTQWHPAGNGSPALSINFNAAGTVDIGESHAPGLTLGPLRKGKWTDYVLHVKFSQNKKQPYTGYVEGWENGVKTVQKTTFAALTDKSDFLKQGIYTSPKEGTTRHDVWHDGMTVWKP